MCGWSAPIFFRVRVVLALCAWRARCGVLQVAAKAAGKGVHSTKEPPMRRVVDLSSDSARAKAFLGSLQVRLCVSLGRLCVSVGRLCVSVGLQPSVTWVCCFGCVVGAGWGVGLCLW